MCVMFRRDAIQSLAKFNTTCRPAFVSTSNARFPLKMYVILPEELLLSKEAWVPNVLTDAYSKCFILFLPLKAREKDALLMMKGTLGKQV